MKLPCSLADVFLPCYLVEQIGSRNATSFSLSVRFNNDPIRANVEMLAISYSSVTFPLLIWLYLNLKDKVLISGRSIVANRAGQPIGLEAKLQRGARVRQPNTCFAWDLG
ncbi:hypothetical protein KY290_029780 [Solanum tuberosum]|uniref:Uncharacterized protein n=1 Tax=Solanum tuberosum TaxID=4113 RepID=A0ABQ7UNR1_SOLTU|nr:hypothetical protein KY289_029002 [Solanum tuberosum]KAH0663900.1 hypothetical protein KY284_028831 [Solanum tuberosum]KAH0667619.1 hypothetical protein KY285_028825 [Solanum tuberosum]KAH0750548.1 hypothetical protein KY290_029780 [Solanum tuberosum]